MRNHLHLVVVIAVVGCAAEKVVTRIDSEPAGARIEVNEDYIGTTPVDVTLPQKGEHHRLKHRVIVKATPTGQGQLPQQKFLSSQQEAPERLLFIMTPPPPVTPP